MASFLPPDDVAVTMTAVTDNINCNQQQQRGDDTNSSSLALQGQQQQSDKENTAPSLYTRSRDIVNDKNAPVRFVFVAGLEGTGHELSKTLLYNNSGKGSPIIQRLKKLNVVEDMEKLETTLHRKVWVAHCPKRDAGLEKGYNETIALFQKLQSRFEQEKQTTLAENKEFTPGTIFLGFSQVKVSYPFGYDNCRPLRYPNLDIFDQACQQAGVACEIALLYRDPHAIVHSNQRRKFDKHLPKAIHLYISMNMILQMQLASFARRTMGCWGLFEMDQSSTLSMGRALGFDNQHDWKSYRDSIMRNKPPLTEEERRAIVPEKYRIYMDSLLRSHEDVLEQCRRQEKIQPLA